MAVPKKKTSKSKRNKRRYIWNIKVYESILFANSLGKSITNLKSKSFLINK